MNFISTGYQISEEEFYEYSSVDNSNVIFCPHCGAINHIFGYQTDYLYCVQCGKIIS